MQVLTHLLQQDAAQVMVLPIDWRQYDTRSPLLAEIARGIQPIEKTRQSSPAVNVRSRLQAAPPNQRRALLLAHVREQAIKVLGLSSVTYD